MYSLLYFLLALAILIAVHEFGHFWVARRCGVKVLKFSIGFGKPIWQKTGLDGTQYIVAAIPLGGYVKMLDEREGKVAESELAMAFNRKPLGSRAAIVAAGPAANILFAIAAYWLVFVLGISGVRSIIGDIEAESPAAFAQLKTSDEIKTINGDTTPTWSSVHHALTRISQQGGKASLIIESAGIESERTLEIPKQKLDVDSPNQILQLLGISPVNIGLEPIVGKVIKDQAADKAGLQAGDRLVEVDGKALKTWRDWVEMIRTNPDTDLNVLIERSGQAIALALRPKKNEQGIGQIGASVDSSKTKIPDELLAELRYGPIAALGKAVTTTWQFSSLTIKSLAGMLSGDVSSKNIGGPITIAQFAGASADRGFIAFISFLAVISISLGILNLLPIPVLDGGHLALFLVEWLRGSPLSEQMQLQGQKMGLIVLLGLMFLAFFNDLSRLFG